MSFLNPKWDFCSSPGIEQKYTRSICRGPREWIRDPHLLRLVLSLDSLGVLSFFYVRAQAVCACVVCVKRQRKNEKSISQ